MAVKTVFVDTNVILDFLLKNPGFFHDSKKIFGLVELGRVRAFISSSSVTDIFYISRKKLTVPIARMAIEDILNLFEVVNVDKSDLRGALAIPIADVEDALQVWCAKKAGVETIITNNTKDFQGADIPVVTSANFSIE
jgi:predicted nucleic acid-binding protein